MSELSPARVGKLGSSHIAALFGCSPYLTRLQLYAHFVQGLDIDAQDNERMAWGKRLQDDILDAVVERTGWEVLPNSEDAWVDHGDPTLRCGCTLDAAIFKHERGPGIIECKNVDWLVYKNEWNDAAAPRHVELQVQHQLFVTGASFGAIAALVGGNEMPPLRLRDPLPRVHRMIEAEIRAFWKEVDERRPPEPRDEADLQALASLYPAPIEDPPLDLTGDNELPELAGMYQWGKERLSEGVKTADLYKARILAKAGDHSVILGPAGLVIRISKSRVPESHSTRKAHIRTAITIREDATAASIAAAARLDEEPADYSRTGWTP